MVVLTSVSFTSYNLSRQLYIDLYGVIDMKVGVLMGGISSEREISLLSGKEVLNNLDKSKYEALPIILNSKEEIIERLKM